MQEYEDAKRSDCFECAGLGYIWEGESLEDLTATHCKCKRGRALRIATLLAKDWYYQAGHGHDPEFLAGAPDIFSPLAGFVRDNIRERIQEMLHAARAQGRIAERKPVLNAHELEIVKKLYALTR